MPSARPNFCAHCGAALDATTNYCPQCGTQCVETTPEERPAAARHRGTTTTDRAGDGPASNREQFRRRVDDHLLDGWDVERDSGDRVVLRKREYGSVKVHAVLLVFTGGVGNLLYGWHKYNNEGERRILRADGDDTLSASLDRDVPSGHRGSRTGSTGSTGSTLVGYVGGALLLLSAMAMFASFDVVVMTLGVFFFAAALWAMPATRRRLQNRHPPTTFGRTQSTEETTRVDPDAPCVVCSGAIEEGVERSYREEVVVAGVPLFETASGENNYCRSCASGGLSEFTSGASPTADRPVETEF
ncbi:zinc ribbon domain-containing protein [Halomarina rubra]|uniref:Zinc-ribbon domain-containing protein n=1 Tax=Halomarina rubra TaxID=2071873 RepID=A0ABD6B0H1_9EURY|nr:zinc ribbon domain-containing protein [Halomarina rubra]